MDKVIFIQNLEVIITDRCNLKCEHCARGKFQGLDMSDEVITTLFGNRHIWAIGSLFISGGEPMLALDTLEKVFTSIIDNGIQIDKYGIITSGTIYNEKFITLLNYFEEYVSKTSRLSYEPKGYFEISADEYHLAEVNRVFGEDNLQVWQQMEELQKSKYFQGFRPLSDKLLRAGYAALLNEEITKTYIPKNVFICHNNRIFSIGPSLSVNPKGYFVLENTSFEDQETLNFGNVLDTDIIESAMKRGARVLKRKDWNRAVYEEINKSIY